MFAFVSVQEEHMTHCACGDNFHVAGNTFASSYRWTRFGPPTIVLYIQSFGHENTSQLDLPLPLNVTDMEHGFAWCDQFVSTHSVLI